MEGEVNNLSLLQQACYDNFWIPLVCSCNFPLANTTWTFVRKFHSFNHVLVFQKNETKMNHWRKKVLAAKKTIHFYSLTYPALS